MADFLAGKRITFVFRNLAGELNDAKFDVVKFRKYNPETGILQFWDGTGVIRSYKSGDVAEIK